MLNRKTLVKTALTWLDTPYQHQVGLKGVGVDCAYLIGKIAEECGLIDNFVVEPYSIEWHLHSREERMCNIVESFGAMQIPIGELKMGDILAFRYGRVCSHLGLMLPDNRFIHAHLKSKKVLVNSLSGEFLTRLERAYRFPNLED